MEDKDRLGRQAGTHALLGLDTTDCVAEFSRMNALGMRFHEEPQSGPWGTGFQLEDLYGNRLFLSQEPRG
jgi:Glyoxalase/Bleomycin resistance protein/Dioxygenase superfamily